MGKWMATTCLEPALYRAAWRNRFSFYPTASPQQLHTSMCPMLNYHVKHVTCFLRCSLSCGLRVLRIGSAHYRFGAGSKAYGALAGHIQWNQEKEQTLLPRSTIFTSCCLSHPRFDCCCCFWQSVRTRVAFVLSLWTARWRFHYRQIDVGPSFTAPQGRFTDRSFSRLFHVTRRKKHLRLRRPHAEALSTTSCTHRDPKSCRSMKGQEFTKHFATFPSRFLDSRVPARELGTSQ